MEFFNAWIKTGELSNSLGMKVSVIFFVTVKTD